MTTQNLESLAVNLASAETLTKVAAGDLAQARAQRQTSAVEVIHYADLHRPDLGDVQHTLLTAGVPKGTVSKINSVLRGIIVGTIERDDVKSLNGAYTLLKNREKALAAASSTASSSTPTAPPPAAAATTPDDALEIILNTIRHAGGEDAVFRAAGDWIDKITNAISDLTRSIAEEEE